MELPGVLGGSAFNQAADHLWRDDIPCHPQPAERRCFSEKLCSVIKFDAGRAGE